MARVISGKTDSGQTASAFYALGYNKNLQIKEQPWKWKKKPKRSY